MSYDYNALVVEIQTARMAAAAAAAHQATTTTTTEQLPHFQHVLSTFETLSAACPMTPILWMQYAHDAEAMMQLALSTNNGMVPKADSTLPRETRLQTLELGLTEFPGYALLQLHYLELLLERDKDEYDAINARKEIWQAFENALHYVGVGAHRHEDGWVARLYEWYAEFAVQHSDAGANHDDFHQIWVRRAQTPMREANDGIVSDYINFCRMQHAVPDQAATAVVENARRTEARCFARFVEHEQAVDAAMHAEGVLGRQQIGMPRPDWKVVLTNGGGGGSDSPRFGMGLGGPATGAAFVQYGQAVQDAGREASVQDAKAAYQKLCVGVYERGVAECPTAEALWLAYLSYLESSGTDSSNTSSSLVAHRACRNCPYSVPLAQRRLEAYGRDVQDGRRVLEPDDLVDQVQQALAKQFLPHGVMDGTQLFLTATRIVKNRVLHLIAAADTAGKKKKNQTAFDDAVPTRKHSHIVRLSEETSEEVHDLCTDLDEMYTDMDEFLKKEKAADARESLMTDWGLTKAYLLEPLAALTNENQAGNVTAPASLTYFQQACNIKAPPHPDTLRRHIQHVLLASNTSPSCQFDVMQRWRHVRHLYESAIKQTGRPKDRGDHVALRRFDIALLDLSHDWIEFERVVGSRPSLEKAEILVRRKYDKIATPEVAGYQSSAVQQGRNTAVTEDVSPGREMQVEKLEAEAASLAPIDSAPAVAAPAANNKPSGPKYHPYTVKVSNLAERTEDMDLVDMFRQKCGPVVHARIVRDKQPAHVQTKPKSKGYAFVQFEERGAAEIAIQLHDVVGLHEQTLAIERSHMPAVHIVPPGMHRVSPKGEGKASKKNEKRRRERSSTETSSVAEESVSKGGSVAFAKDDAPVVSALAFQPRGVAQKARKKPKLSLGEQAEHT